MSKPRLVVAATAVCCLILLPMPLAGGSPRCPPIEGLVTTLDLGSHSIVAFVESTSGETYRLNKPEVLRSHIGHTVTIIAHPNDRGVLIIHGDIHCSDHRDGGPGTM